MNIDTDGNGKADLNIDINIDGKPDVAIDTNGDGKPDKNLVNTDTNKDGYPDLNVDTNNDGYPDINIDINGDGKPDINLKDIDDDSNDDDNLNDDNDHEDNDDDSDEDKDNDDKEDDEVDALFTIMASNDVVLKVKSQDLTKESVGNKEFTTIYSNEATTKVSLISNDDKTRCRYNIIFRPEINTFENKYISPNGKIEELKNQLMLELYGTINNGNSIQSFPYIMDLIENGKEEVILMNNFLIEDDEDNKFTNHEWKIKLGFNNYRDYNQTNNADKLVKGKLVFQQVGCEKVK